MEKSSQTAVRISKALKKVMFDYEISGRQLAESSGIHEGQISDFRGAKRVPSVENLLKLLESLPDDARDYFLDLLFNKKDPLQVAEKSNEYKKV